MILFGAMAIAFERGEYNDRLWAWLTPAEHIEYALASPDEALEFAKAWGRGIDDETNREFVGMYVNDRTIDYKEEGRASIRQFIKEGQTIGMIRDDFDTATMRFIGEP